VDVSRWSGCLILHYKAIKMYAFLKFLSLTSLRCGHIYHFSANFRQWNPLILKWIHPIRNFAWGWKISSCKFLQEIQMVKQILFFAQQKTTCALCFMQLFLNFCREKIRSFQEKFTRSGISHAEDRFPYSYNKFSWSHKFVALTNKNMLSLKATTVW